MNDFGRVLKLAVRRKYALAGILCSSLVIALLWGANISVIFPLTEIVFKGQGLAAYADERLTESADAIAELEQRRKDLGKQLAKADPQEQEKLRLAIGLAERQQATIEESARSLKWSKPWIDRYAPTGPFDTLLLLVGVLVLGTAVKLVALMVNLIFVQYIAERTCLDLRAIFFRKALGLDLDSFGENG